MEKIIGYCGIVCSDCEAYQATQANDRAALEAVAAKWREEFNAPEMTADSILCDGCLSTNGRTAGYCSVCELRACGQQKAVINCAHCSDYACEKLSSFLAQVPAAQAVLEGIRQAL